MIRWIKKWQNINKRYSCLWRIPTTMENRLEGLLNAFCTVFSCLLYWEQHNENACLQYSQQGTLFYKLEQNVINPICLERWKMANKMKKQYTFSLDCCNQTWLQSPPNAMYFRGGEDVKEFFIFFGKDRFPWSSLKWIT